MASQGPKNPGTLVSDGSNFGSVSWTNPSNASVSDNIYATANASGSDTEYLKVTNFGFTIPSTATINGILAEVEVKGAVAGFFDNVILVKGGTVQGNNKAAGTVNNTDTYYPFGSSSDKWGLTLTPNDVNAIDFGVVFSFSIGNFSVDHIRITVFYTPLVTTRATDGKSF